MRLETFIRKSLGMKAHTVVKVEELPTGEVVAQVDRLPGRRLACGECGRPAAKVATTRRPIRRSRESSSHVFLVSPSLSMTRNTARTGDFVRNIATVTAPAPPADSWA